jgi:hypothetical protein
LPRTPTRMKIEARRLGEMLVPLWCMEPVS